MLSFKDLEMKEKNLDKVINENAGHRSATRGCEVRKLDAKHCRISRKKLSKQKKRNRKHTKRRNRRAIPSVSIVVYVNRNTTSAAALKSSTGEETVSRALSNLGIRSSQSNENEFRTSRQSSGKIKIMLNLADLSTKINQSEFRSSTKKE